MEFVDACKIEDIDSRDHIAEEVLGAKPFSWEKGYNIEDEVGKLKVEHQGRSLSCVGNAISKYVEVFMKNSDRSARDIYSRIFLKEYGGGAFIRAGMKQATKIGVCKEALMPSYDAGNPPSEEFMRRLEENPATIADALTAKAESYAVIQHHSNMDTIADILSRSRGVVTGVKLSREGWRNSPFVRPPKEGEKTYGHAIYLGKAKLISGKKYIKFLNSYGDKWGDKGWGYLDRDYFRAYVKGARTVPAVFNLRILYYSNNKKMKIIGDKRNLKQFIVGDDKKLHWIFNETVLETFHSMGAIDKNNIEWKDNLDEYTLSEPIVIAK